MIFEKNERLKKKKNFAADERKNGEKEAVNHLSIHRHQVKRRHV